MKTSNEINEISKAMSHAQAEMRPAIKSSSNPFFKSKYADFSSVWEAIREPLRKHELSVWQDVATNDQGVEVSTRVTHSSGQWIECGPLTIPLAKRDAQAIGSAISYAKRYSLSAAVGVVADSDDDAEAAMNRVKTKEMITQSQVKALASLLDECEPAYREKIDSYLSSRGIESYAQIDPDAYEKIYAAAVKHRDSLKAQS